MVSLATAWVDIVPRFKDLSSTFNKELKGIDAAGAGSRLGSQLGSGLTTGHEPAALDWRACLPA